MVVSGVVSLATVPFVVVYAGKDAWASVAVGQSLGSIIGIFTLLGWVQNGPTEVARTTPEIRGAYFARSAYVRSLSLVVTVPAICAASVLLGTTYVWLCALAALAMLVTNLGASWFFVGEGNPRGLFLFETLPRALGIVVATAALAWGASPVVYGVLTLAGSVCAVAASWADVFRRNRVTGFEAPTLREVGAIVWGQKHGIGTAVLSAVYQSVPLLIVQGLYAGATASFALADKIKQQAMTAYRPVSQVAQGWTPRGSASEVRRRVEKVAKLIVPVATVAAVVSASAGPFAANLLSGGNIQVGWGMSAAFGIAFGMNIVSLTVGVACLVPIGREAAITASAALGLLTFCVSAVPLGILAGGGGIAWSVACGQTVVAVYQLVVLAAHLRTEHRGDRAGDAPAERRAFVGAPE